MKRWLKILALTVLITGCTVGRDHERPDTRAIEQSVDLASLEEPGFSATEPVEAWWMRFNDPVLSELSNQAIENNKNILAAIETVFAARSIQDEVEYDRFPTVEARASYVRQRLSREGIFGAAADRTFNTYDAGFDALWELDLFGRISRGIEAAEADAAAAEAGLADVMVMMLSEIGRNYMELRGAQLELNVAERNLENQRETLELIERQADVGRASDLDVARATSQLRLTEASVPPLLGRINAAINKLGVLTGDTPGKLYDRLSVAAPLPSMPATVAVGDAKSLIRRRPDIRQAEQQLAAATARYGVAVANLYPSVSILGSLGFQSQSLSNFGSGRTNVFSVGPQINWAAFNIGRVQAQVAQADAETRASLLNFEQRVLEALEDIQTSMTNFSREDERRQRLVDAAVAAGTAARLARVRYDGGLDNFLDVLDAERTLLNAENQLAVSETTVALNLIAVYKALGGGWQQAVVAD